MKKPSQAALPVVEVSPIREHAGGIDFEVDGVVIPFREVEVPAQVAGQISFKSDNCRIGRTVKRGEILLRIDPYDFQLEVRKERMAAAMVCQSRRISARMRATSRGWWM